MSEAKKNQILIAARSVFLRYGYKRVSMNDIAAEAGVSRPALYLLFKNKEEICIGVIRQWIDETIADVHEAMAAAAAPMDKLRHAFDVWTVRPFALAMTSIETQELLDCTFGFARSASEEGYERFEAAITPVLASLPGLGPARSQLSVDRIAHLLTGAVRGFKQTASTPDELRLLIGDLLDMSIGTVHDGAVI